MKKQGLSYRQRQALGSLAMANLNRQKPGDEKYRGAAKETPAQEFARMRREELAANGDISPLQKAIEDRDGTTARKKQLREIWSQPGSAILEINAGTNLLTKVRLIDAEANLPHTPDGQSLENNDATQQAAVRTADAVIAQNNLDEEARNKVVAFVVVHADADSRVDVTNIATWERAYERLMELGVIGINNEPQTPTTVPERSADDLKTVAEKDYFENHAGPLWSSLMDYFAQKLNFYPNDKQKRALIDYVVDHGLQVLDSESWNIARRSLVRSSVLPDSCLSADDRLCIELDNIDTSTPQGRAEYARKKTRLIYNEPD